MYLIYLNEFIFFFFLLCDQQFTHRLTINFIHFIPTSDPAHYFFFLSIFFFSYNCDGPAQALGFLFHYIWHYIVSNFTGFYAIFSYKFPEIFQY